MRVPRWTNLLIVIALGLAPAIFAGQKNAQPADRRAEPLPKLLPLREQTAVREQWLKTRLDTMLLPMMRRNNVSMWIVTTEEFHPDTIAEYVAPPIPYVGRRDFFIFTDRGGDKLERIALVRYVEEHLKSFFEVLNSPAGPTLKKIVEERQPKTIALNMGGTRGATNGLTYDAHRFLAETLGEEYAKRFVSAAPLIVEYQDTRLPEEFDHYRTAVTLTDLLTQRALSNEVITPGKTTVGDVRWWLLQQVNNLGLGVWFQADLRVQRQNKETGKTSQFLSVADEAMVIERGDLIHVDFGLNYMGFSTDWQKHAYALKPGEKGAPEGMKKALANTNRLQDLVFKHARAGVSGSDVYAAVMADCKNEGIEAMIYSHSVGTQGHALGAGIDFRRPIASGSAGGSAGAAPELLRLGSYTSIELNTSTPVAEWGGQKVTIMAEDDAYMTAEGFKWFRPRQTQFYLVR
jgi:Xaa-Pro aminopeptidase